MSKDDRQLRQRLKRKKLDIEINFQTVRVRRSSIVDFSKDPTNQLPNLAGLFQGGLHAECYIDRILKQQRSPQVQLRPTPEEYAGPACLLSSLVRSPSYQSHQPATPKLKTQKSQIIRWIEEEPRQVEPTASREEKIRNCLERKAYIRELWRRCRKQRRVGTTVG